MARNEHNQPIGRQGTPENRVLANQPTNSASVMSMDEELLADVDEPPDLECTPRPSALKLHDSFKASFSKTRPSQCDRKESLLTHALHSNTSSPVEEDADTASLRRGLSSASTCSNNSMSAAELTSDGGFTSPGTRTSTPSPPLPPTVVHQMVPLFNKKPFEQRVTIVRHDEDNIGPLQKAPAPLSGVDAVEATLGRKRCISFACGGRKEAPKPALEVTIPKAPSEPKEAPKRACTIKFACPFKVSTDAPSKVNKPRMARAVSPAPVVHRSRSSSKAPSKSHRDSDSTVRNPSPVAMRKQAPAKCRTRRLSVNSDLARSEAFRFHEFASSEEEVDEWIQESTCHRSRLTISDTLKIENGLRQLGEEAEEEALDDEEEDADEEADDMEIDDDEDEEDDESDAEEYTSDEGFQTDDEEGFAGSDDESDAGSDFEWWAPGAQSTAATSLEHLEHIRPGAHRSDSISSMGSNESVPRFQIPEKPVKRKRSRPVNIRVPSPELPDSTDFVCGTLDEDRPLEAAYMTCLERRRAAKHKITPQDIDPTFPTSDPEMDEEDEDDELGDQMASESDQHLMMHGEMDKLDRLDAEFRGRGKSAFKRRSPAPSPRRLRSPPPSKRAVHRSPPPRKLFGHSPRRLRSPAPGVRLRSPPPTRRGSAIMSPQSPQRPGLFIKFGGLAERPALTMSSSLPRTPMSAHAPEDLDGEDTCREMPIGRGAIDIRVGLEKKRQRRKEQQYKKKHPKGGKEKRCAPGKGCERMREMGLGLAAHKGKTTGFAFGIPSTPDQKDMLVLSV